MSNSTNNDGGLDAWRKQQNASYDVIDRTFDGAEKNLVDTFSKGNSNSTEVFSYAFAKELKAMEEAIMDAAGDTVASTAKATQTTRKLAVLMADCIKHATEFDLAESEIFAAEWSSSIDQNSIVTPVHQESTSKDEEFAFTFNSMM